MPATSKSKQRWLMIALLLLWLIYAGLTLLAPATRAVSQYRINLTQVNLLRVSIMVPLLLIWLAALFAVVRFWAYTKLVAGSRESQGFKQISWGIFLLFLVLVVPSFVNLVFNFFPNTEQAITIGRTYLSIILYLLAFWFLFQGSNRLLALLPGFIQSPRPYRVAAVAIAVLAGVYAWAIFHNQFRTVSTDPLIRPTYFLPDWLIITTIFLPYLLIWLWGSWTVINVRTFAQRVEGIIYRRAFLSITYGLTYTVILLIGLQFLSQAATVFGRSSLKVILLIIYALVLAIALGYLYLARGARQLSTIEEVE